MLPQIALVTDPGPDPDDVKTILVLAMLHRQKAISLRAVIANGGAQPEKRARLAKCILTHVQQRSVPVGVGSRGQDYQAQPHEYEIPGYNDVKEDELEVGSFLLQRVLREAKPKRRVTVANAVQVHMPRNPRLCFRFASDRPL